MNELIIQSAKETLRITREEALKNSRYIDEVDAYHIWQAGRGGGSLIINEAGESLAAGSSVPPTELIQEFKNGKRN